MTRRKRVIRSTRPDGNLPKYGVHGPRYFALLSSLWEVEPRPIKEDLRRVREAGKRQASETYRWKRNRRGVWWLTIR